MAKAEIILPAAGKGSAGDTILATKIHVPRARSAVVARYRLLQRLNEGLERGFTLISAPAGFGKTTLVASWLRDQGLGVDVAWMSLDKQDNDPIRFWHYVAAALGGWRVDVAEEALAMLHLPEPPPTETILTALINALSASEGNVVLVLDDYHVIEAQPIHEALSFLLDHLPAQLHVVMTTRSDPPLALARLRARRQMAELRANDLRFTLDESAAFLNQLMGLKLSSHDVGALEERTEGWIAGLQLAALSMQGLPEVAPFVAAFTGSHRHVVDYLVEEVLARLSDRLQSFLLETSILDRLAGPLCDAVTDQHDGQAMLEALERANLFIVPLDEERQWYRYHHLFRDVVNHRLRQSQRDRVVELHSRAAAWYAQEGWVEEASRHALAAGQPSWAAQIVEQHAPGIMDRGEVASLRQWLQALPPSLIRSRPQLSLAQALVLLYHGQLDGVEALLQDAERMAAGARELTATTGEEYHGSASSWLGDIDNAVVVMRGTLARLQGDHRRALELSRQALQSLSEDSSYWRANVVWNIALSTYSSGDFDAATRAFSEILADNWNTGNSYRIFYAAYGLGRVQVAQGRLHQAAKTCRQAIQLANQTDKPLPVAGTVYLAMGELLYEWNDLEGARRYLMQGLELAKRVGDFGPLLHGYMALSHVRQAQDDVAGALELLEEARRITPIQEAVDYLILPSVARLHLAQGNLPSALQWAQVAGLELGELRQDRMYAYVMLARVLLARKSWHEARDLLIRLAPRAEAAGRVHALIKILVLTALVLETIGEAEAAQTTFKRALCLAEPGGYIRTFVEGGQPIVALLRRAHNAGDAIEYTAMLLAACGQPPGDATSSAQPILHLAQPLLEPLSEREMEVLELIAKGAQNQAIARQLFVALDTVKKHVSRILDKLGVNNRTEAVTRARELGIIR